MKILETLIAKLRDNKVRNHKPSPAEQRDHAISFVYGNMSMHNPNITRDMVAEIYDAERNPKRDRFLTAEDCAQMRAAARAATAGLPETSYPHRMPNYVRRTVA